MDKSNQIEGNRVIVFWLFIDDLHKYQKEVKLEIFKQDPKISVQLLPTHLHQDILQVIVPFEDIIYDYNKIRYIYRICDKYVTDEINRTLSNNQLKQNLVEIYDTPQHFSEIGFFNKIGDFLHLKDCTLLRQSNKQYSLLKFIQPNSSIKNLLNLREFFMNLGDKYCDLLPNYSELSIPIVVKMLQKAQSQFEPMGQIFSYLELIDESVKNKYIVELSEAVSQYFVLFAGGLENKERLRCKLISLYSEKTNFEQRLHILLSQYCVWTEQEAREQIGRKDFNKELMINPQFYIEIFSQHNSKYQELFKEQIFRIIQLMSQQQNITILQVLKQNQDLIKSYPKLVKDNIEQSIFDMNNISKYLQKDKAKDILMNITTIREVLNIPFYKSRNYIQSSLSFLGDSQITKELANLIINTCMEYKIDIQEYEDLCYNHLIEMLKEPNEVDFFTKQVILQNPNISIDKIYLLAFQNYVSQPYHFYIPRYFRLKNKFIQDLNLIRENQLSFLKQFKQEKLVNKQLQRVEISSQEKHYQKVNVFINKIIYQYLLFYKKKDEPMNLVQKENTLQNISQETLDEERFLEQKFFNQFKNIILTKEKINEFTYRSVSELEKIITITPTTDLTKIFDSQSFNKEDEQEFKVLFQKRTYLKMKKETESEDQFFKTYHEIKKQLREKKSVEVVTVFNYLDRIALERIQHILDNISSLQIFNSKFIFEFLNVCDKNQIFYKTINDAVQEIIKSINTFNLTKQQLKNIFNKKYSLEVLKIFQFEGEKNKNMIEEWLDRTVDQISNYKQFFEQFKQFFPKMQESLEKHTMDNLLLSQLQTFMSQFNGYDMIVQFYFNFNNSIVFKKILRELQDNVLNEINTEINNLETINNIQPVNNIQDELLNKRNQGFSKLLILLINNLYQFSNVVFNSQQGSITNLDKFNNTIQQLLGTQIQQNQQQQQQIQQQQQQIHLQQQIGDQIVIQQQQQHQLLNNQNQSKEQLFSEYTSIHDLYEYCGENVDEFIESIKIFHKVFGVQSDFNVSEQNIKKCYITIFYSDSSSIINEVGDRLKTNWNSKENKQLKQLFETAQKYQDMKKQPLKLMMGVQINENIINQYSILILQLNIVRNMDLFLQSQIIIEHAQQNKKNNITYLDMRDFIGDNDYDLSSFLTVLNEFSPFFNELLEIQTRFIQGTDNQSLLNVIKEINELIEIQINTPIKLDQWQETIKNFHKIATIENNIDKKKSYLNLLKKMYLVGKTTIKVGENNQEATFLIECDGKKYSEQEIREISSRVLIEKHSIKAIFEQDNKQRHQTKDLIKQLQEGDQQGKQKEQEQKMENFKRQLELIQDLKQIIQDMRDYGYFLFESEEYIYNNQNKNYQSNMNLMKMQLKSFEDQLKQWKQLIQDITTEYPKFSFISYSFYPILDQYLQGIIYEYELNKSIKQIVKYQIQSNPFDIQNVLNAMASYKYCQKEKRLFQIGSQFYFFFLIFSTFYTHNYQIYNYFINYQFSCLHNWELTFSSTGRNDENEKRIRLIQYLNTQEAIYHLLQQNELQQNMKSQYYLFCDERTQIQDIQLFIQRYKYLTENQPMKYFIIINKPLTDILLNEFIILQNDQPYLNYLFILIKRDYYDEKLSLIQQNSIEDIKQYSIEKLKKYNHIQQLKKNAIFYCSVVPGSGKSNSIWQQSQIYESELIRIPTNGDGDKKKFTEQLMINTGNNEDARRVYHIDLYESETIELNFILFEMIILKSVNFNSKRFQDLGAQSIFLIEVNNTLSLFGSEMGKMEQSAYLKLGIIEEELFQQGLRTTVITKSFELCRKVSISCLQNTYLNNNNITNEQLLTNKADSLIQFSSFLQDFVTFQEQQEGCVTSFFQNIQSTPQSIRELYKKQKENLLLFDQEQRPEILINWLMMLCNKHIQVLYKDKESSFENIKNEELRAEAQKIIIQKDNFFKIAMIFLRIRSQTPIIIMGEAGIGKTALIKLLSLIMEANFKTKIIHAGVTEDEVIQFIQQSEIELNKNPSKRTVLFFDEVNTNKLVSGLFKEIIVDRHLKGRKLNSNIIPIAALNPYKLKSEEQQKIMQAQIHGGIKKDLVNRIKGSDLEYTVNPIPDSMYSFSWNYGGLKPKDEKSYITQILLQMNFELQQNSQFQFQNSFIETSLSDLVFFSQEYLRNVMGRISACSLRDVKRFVTLLKNNINFLIVSSNLSQAKRLDIIGKDIPNLAIYLSFYINYCVRIPLNDKRIDYLQKLTWQFTAFTNNQINEQFEKIEKFLINQIDVPIGIAKNYSLRQNTFILFICIINKIPVCLIGPPGSSKTLSLRQLIQSMQGVNSRSELFKQYPALMPLYYQGHIQSTSERIMEVFENAQKKQEAFNSKEVGHKNLSLVYIDEIGLAEISPHNPLKVLHATLEKPDIAVSCISNWPLDASKMNRMLTVYRMDVNDQQLVETFQSIFEEIKQQQKNIYIKSQLEKSQLNNQEIQLKIANIYLNYLKDLKTIEQSGFEQFHGPRDFFSACKLICSEEINVYESLKRNEYSNSQSTLNDRIIKSFYRHFSGLIQSQILLEEQFIKMKIQNSQQFNPAELIEQNLNEQPKFFISRHLMIISEDLQNSMIFLKQKLNNKDHQFFVGSDFVEDAKMQACYNIINKIVSCIEKGMVVILQNLDNIYQSLYEVLNQSYRYYNGKYFCKISFGAESSNIEVSENFKLILLVNQRQVYRMDGPLLNRFEKHLLNDNTILSSSDAQNIIVLNQSLDAIKQFQDIQLYNYNISNDIFQRQHPFFRFQNKAAVLQNYYLQYKLQKEQFLCTDTNQIINSQDQDIIIKRILHLLDFFQVYLPCSDNTVNSYKQGYIKSSYHFSLNEFIQNRIIKPDQNFLLSVWNIFQRERNIPECQVRQFTIFSPQTYIPDSSYQLHEIITLNQILSEQDLTKKISNFLNKGLPQGQLKLKKMNNTFQHATEFQNIQNQNLFQSQISLQDQQNINQKILIIIGDMSKQGPDSFERIVFTMQKVDEQVTQFLSSVQQQGKNQPYTTQLNIIVLLKVEEIFTMVPISGNWEFYYIENLSPFHQFKNDSQDHQELDLFTYVKENLSLQVLVNNRALLVQNIIDLEALTKFFLTNDGQIFSHAYKDISYQLNDEKSEFDYKSNRLEMIITIFQNNYLNASLPVIYQMVLIIMKHKYKIETLDDLVFSYLMPKGLSVQSSSLHTSIINGLKQMVQQSLKILIYHLESLGIIYGMANCQLKQFQNYANIQISNYLKKYSNTLDSYFKPLIMSKDLIINESEDIYKVLQSYQLNIKNLQESVMIRVDDLFSTFYNSVRQNLSSNKSLLDNFSEQILKDIQNTINPQIDPAHIQIAKALLLITRNDDESNNLNEYSLEEINLSKYKSKTDFVIPIFLVLYIYKEQIIELGNLIKSYERFIVLSSLASSYIQMNKKKNIDLSESLNLFKEWTISQIFDSIQPMSAIIQQNQLLNQFYPTTSKPFLEFLQKNNKNDIHLKYKDYITLINIICTHFNDILEKKNLLSSLNFDKIMSLDFKEIIIMKDQFYQFFKDYRENTNQQNIQNPNLYINLDQEFILKWSEFMKALVITSTEQGYFKGFDVFFIKILLDLELDEMKINNNCLNLQFRMFLNRIFKSIKNNFTFENTQKVFNVSSQELFCDKKGNPYHTEYYSLVLFGETIQKTIYKDLLDKRANETIEFLYILVEYNFNELSTIQKIIYLSIFKEFVVQMINTNNISESLLFQKIQQINQNQMEIECEQRIDDIFMQGVHNLDKSLQSFFSGLTIQPLQIFIVKYIIYTKRNCQEFINNSFYLKGSKWLNQFQALSFNEMYNKKEINKDDDCQPILEQIVMKYLKNNNSIFKQIYLGNISSQMYYPMNMIHQIQSQVDFDTEREGDQTKSIYQCFKCKKCFINNSFSLQSQMIQENQTINCSQCLNSLNIIDPSQVTVIQDGLQNKLSLNQIFKQERGFCLQLHFNYPNLSIKNCRPDILRLFSMLYHTIFSLSLKHVINNPFNQVVQAQYFHTNGDQIQQEQINILQINKILKLHYNEDPQQYLINQNFIAFNHLKQQYQQCSQTKIVQLIDITFKFLLESQLNADVELINLLKHNNQIHQQIEQLIIEFQQSNSNLIKAQLEEDYSFINITLGQYYQMQPKSLRLNVKILNAYQAILHMKQNSVNKFMLANYPILLQCLEVDYLQQLSHQLNILITFYQRIMIYFSNQFEQKQIYELTLLQALKKLGKDNSESLYSFYVQKFVPCWNELIEQINKQSQSQGINSIPQINENTMLNNLVYSSKNGNTAFLYILQHLINCQDQFIQALLNYCLDYGQQKPSVYQLYSQIWIQFLDSQLNKQEKGLQDVDPENNLLKQPNLELLEKFCIYGQEEGDCIYERVLIEYESLQTNFALQIFKGTCFIGLEKSLEFQFLPSIKEFQQADQMIIPQECIENTLAENIRSILSNKDIAYETLQKMMTIYSFFKSSPIQQAELSLNTAMKQLNLRANLNKLEKAMEDHLKLKHLQNFIQLLEELNMNNLIQLCNPFYKINNIQYQQEEELFKFINKDKQILNKLKIIIGRLIIRFLSSENIVIDPNEFVLNIIFSNHLNFNSEQQFINLSKLNKLLDQLRVCNCYDLYQKILDEQTKPEQSQNQQNDQDKNNPLYLENFTDNNSRMNIRQLTCRNQEKN